MTQNGSITQPQIGFTTSPSSDESGLAEESLPLSGSDEKLGDIAPHQLSVNSNIPSSDAVTAEKSVIMDGFCIYTDAD